MKYSTTANLTKWRGKEKITWIRPSKYCQFQWPHFSETDKCCNQNNAEQNKPALIYTVIPPPIHCYKWLTLSQLPVKLLFIEYQGSFGCRALVMTALLFSQCTDIKQLFDTEGVSTVLVFQWLSDWVIQLTHLVLTTQSLKTKMKTVVATWSF